VRLRKVYRGSGAFNAKPKVAVKSMSFGLSVGECFGYLGINGAGKTTTMKILTGELLATSGEAYLGGFDISSEQQRVRRLIGYCPQFDALFDLLSVREHLELYGRLKGLDEGEPLASAIASILEMMNLNAFTHKLAGTLSGGNKRKLSVGIALIGGPKILFLDEPSTGVDPVARRFMWAVISRICTQQRDCCIVLTSHVMEEVEALCTKVGIVVGGRLRCLGSNQQLKSRFGRGYFLEMKLTKPPDATVEGFRCGVRGAIATTDVGRICAECGNAARATSVNPEDEGGWAICDTLRREGSVSADVFARWWLIEDAMEALHTFIISECGGGVAQRVERHGLKVTYVIGSGGAAPVRAPQIFAMAEVARLRCGVEEYGVAQSSLEQIFNYFAAQQDEEVSSVRGMGGAAAATPSSHHPEQPPIADTHQTMAGGATALAPPAAHAAVENPVRRAPLHVGEMEETEV
jgi:ATP-binding cassette subfamily A (ABC1) protein 3